MTKTPSTKPPTLDEQMAAQARIRAGWQEKESSSGALTGCLIAIGIILATFALIFMGVGAVGGWLYLL